VPSSDLVLDIILARPESQENALDRVEHRGRGGIESPAAAAHDPISERSPPE